MAYENTGYPPDRTQAAFAWSRRLTGTLAWAVSLVFFLGPLAGCMSRSLTGMQVSPAAGAVTIAAGQTAQFQAEAVYTESGHATTSGNVTSQTSWQSSNPAVATISAQGLATGVAAGTATITANMNGQFGPVSATSNITVTAGTVVPPRVLTSLAVTPTTQTLATVGQAAQFIAVGTYSSGSPATQNLTNSVSWQSSDPVVARVNSFGLATSQGAGQATITALATASDGSAVSASGTIIVSSAPTPRILTSLAVTPGSQTVATVGQIAQFIAVGTYSSSPMTQNLTTSATWHSSDPSIAQVSSSGLVTSAGVGQATITALATASDNSVVSATGTIIVTSASGARTLTSLVVNPSAQTLATVGQTAQFTALATYSSGSPATQNLTNSATWQSSAPNVAQVNSSGLVTGIGVGQATISALATAADGSVVSASGTLSVTTEPAPRVLTSMVVIPNSQTVATAGQTSQFIAIGTYSSGSPATQDLTDTVSWKSSGPQIVSINSTGLATGVGIGQATISAVATALDGSVTTANGTMSVTNASLPRTLSSLVVIPATQPTTAIGEAVQFIAIGTYNSGNPATQDVTDLAQWQTSDEKVAFVNASGLATTVGGGQATVTAVATSSDGSVSSASGIITASGAGPGPASSQTPTLIVLKFGTGTGVVTGTANGNVVITCGSGTGCTGTFPVNQAVVLTAAADVGSQFDGWSVPCNPATATTCTITMTNDETIGAIFDPFVQ